MGLRQPPGDQDRGQIEDRRGRSTSGGFSVPGGVAGAGLGGLGGAGVLGLVVVLVLHFLGAGSGSGNTDYGSVLGKLPQVAADSSGPVPSTKTDSETQFVIAVVNDVQQTWTQEFQKAGRRYTPTVLVLFEASTPSGCGVANSQTGPFYCPGDTKVYLDLGFFQEMAQRLGATGDFAQAYVIAHEFGHHVEDLLGILSQVQSAERRDPRRANDLSVRVELMADCLAGVWAHSAYQRNLLQPGDIEEAAQAAAAVGDDRLQKSSGGRVNPDQWTHGSSQQRVNWLTAGFNNGQMSACDTFSATKL